MLSALETLDVTTGSPGSNSESEAGDDRELGGEVASRLIDLSGVDLGGLAAIDRPVLASALERIRDEVEHPEEAVAGFNASL